MKLFFKSANENWIVDRYYQELKKHRPRILTDDYNNADVIWMCADWTWNQIPYDVLSKKKVVTTCHHLTPWKFDKDRVAQESFNKLMQVTDLYHTPSPRTKEYLRSLSVKKEIIVHPFWIDTDTFYPMDKETVRKKHNLPQDKFIIFSGVRDTEGSDLKTPKYEKAPDVLAKYIEIISKDREVEVLLGGWRRQYIMSELDRIGVKYYYNELPSTKVINEFYNAADLVVVPSRVEGGPMAIPEAAATMTPVISTGVGVAGVFLSEKSVGMNPCSLDNKFGLDSDVEKIARSLIELEPDVEGAYNNARNYFCPNGIDLILDDIKEFAETGEITCF